MGGLLSGFGGGVIGGATVKLFLDSKQYQTELAAAEGKTKAASTGMGGAFSQLKTFGVAAWAAIGTAAVAFAADAIKAAEEHQVAVDQLNQALGENTDALQQQASALQMVTGFSDEAIMQADTILSRYKLTAAQLQQLNPLILDYARATGQDVPTAAGNIGRALLGNARALKTIGIDYHATGDRAKDFGTILSALQQKVGGVATAFGETAAGKAAILSQKLDELKEKIGAALLPLISKMADELGPLIDDVTRFADGVEHAAAAMPDWVGWLYKVVQLTNPLTLTLKLLGGIGDLLSGPTFSSSTSAAIAGVGSSLQGVGDWYAKATNFTDMWLQKQKDLAAELDNDAGHIKRFGNLTGKELNQWRDDFKSAMDSAVLDLGNLKHNFGLTEGAFIRGSKAMEARGKLLAGAMHELASKKENWVPDGYIQFLETLGPGAIVAFTGLSKQKQHEMVGDWRGTQGAVDSVHGSINKVSAAVRSVPNTKNLDINVNYHYNGFDPTKPIPGS